MVTKPTSTPNVMKVLLVADEEFRGTEFMNELKKHIEGHSAEVEVFVIAPALAGNGIDHELASFDGPIKVANERLRKVLEQLKRVGINAVGRVGDGDPVVAIGDGLREYDADEIIVIAHDGDDVTYGEKDLWKHIKSEFHQPLVELIVALPESGDGPPHVVDVNRDRGRLMTDQEKIDSNRNFPPLTPRDVAGILVGFLGTIGLGLIAVAAGTSDSGDLSGAAAAIVLLAVGAFLLNLGHIVGLLFFQSVRYTGIWEKFMARMSLLYTICALIAALILWQSI